MKIKERYVPSPTEDEPSDAELHFNKEAKLNAIRQLLIRQRSVKCTLNLQVSSYSLSANLPLLSMKYILFCCL